MILWVRWEQIDMNFSLDPIKVDIYPINRIYQLGFTAKLQCRATGYPQPRIIWMRDNIPLVNTTRTTLQNDGSLIIHPYKREDAGTFLVENVS